MRKDIVFFMLIFLSASIIKNCGRENDIVCRCLLDNQNDSTDNYLIEIRTSGIMTVKSGRLKESYYNAILYEKVGVENLSTYDFYDETRMCERKELNAEDIKRVRTCVSALGKIKPANPFLFSDTRPKTKNILVYIIIIKKQKYVFVDTISDELRMFLETLTDISPVMFDEDFVEAQVKIYK